MVSLPFGGCSSSNSGGKATCTTGDEGCACYQNGTCNGDLRCLSNLCVDDSEGAGGTDAQGGDAGAAALGGGGNGLGGEGGSSGSGSGGDVSGNGGADPGAGGAGGEPACAGVLTVGQQGYVTSSGEGSTCWSGYAFTGTSGIVSGFTPTSFESCETSCTLCASGTLAADASFMSAAWVGFSVAQAFGDDTPVGTQTPAGNAFNVSFTNPGGSELRLELVGASQRWCRTLPATSGTVSLGFSSFRTECWNSLGTAYAGQALAGVQLVVPSRDIATPFDACLSDFN